MSKKRPKVTPSLASRPRPNISKQEPQYWRKRLFKGRYTYKGKQFEARNWSVKVQHLGKRKTFSLQSGRRGAAAAEACELYRALRRQGWKAPIVQGGLKPVPTDLQPGQPALPAAGKSGAAYWEQRLIRREYTMSLQPPARQELSVRINHAGTGHYFPLGTDDHRVAAKLALRIYQTITAQGWEAANSRFSRELTVAFRWLDVPLAWTYTTIHTLNAVSRDSPIEPRAGAPAVCEVTVTESDAGTRHALEWCINHMDGFRCVAAHGSAAEALRESTRRRVHLALVSHSLADRPGTVFLAEMKASVPETCGLLYSVYEDSEELFRTTPGGAGTYILRRTTPTRFLEPIEERLKQGRLLGEEMAPAVWQYFKDSLSSMPVGGTARQLANLTQREHEVLALLSKGQPDKEIADQLGISIYTVHEHVRNIFDKLGAHNRTEAAVKFLQK
jgi:DNA-binding NarL/FixJ family response regulator